VALLQATPVQNRSEWWALLPWIDLLRLPRDGERLPARGTVTAQTSRKGLV
jgi:hypothetical protein